MAGKGPGFGEFLYTATILQATLPRPLHKLILSLACCCNAFMTEKFHGYICITEELDFHFLFPSNPILGRECLPSLIKTLVLETNTESGLQEGCLLLVNWR